MTRYLIKFVVMAVLVAGGGYGIHRYEQWRTGEAEKEKLRQQIVKAESEKRELQEYVKRLTAERRVAEIIVVDQQRSGSAVESTTLLFAEYARDGASTLAPRVFTVKGDGAHIDALVIKFEHDYVARGESLRGQSLVLFYRLFGDYQAPVDGFRIDEPGQVPMVYRLSGPRGERVRQFEQELWQNVWKLAADENYRAKMGVRVLSQESPWGQFELDKKYTITLEADGGLTMYQSALDPLWREYRDALRRSKPR